MRTKTVKARRLSTRDQLVVEGKLRRESIPICEFGIDGDRVTVVARGRQGFERLSYKADELVRVKT
jgi:hypothetical protein